MNKASLYTILSLLMLSVPSFAAESLYQYSTTIELFSNNSAHYTANLIFTNFTQGYVTLPLEGSLENLHIDSSGSCKSQNSPLGIDVTCSSTSPDLRIILDYDCNSCISKIKDHFVLRGAVVVPTATRELSVRVKLPEGMGLIKTKGTEVPYAPDNALVGSDGRRPLIDWIEALLPDSYKFEYTVAYEQLAIVDLSGLIGLNIVFVILVIAGVGAFYRFYWKRRAGVRIILPILKSDEKIIVESLMKNDGKGVNQKVLVKESNYSKAKVSKVLKSLQDRGIIRLERTGRTNTVYMQKEMKGMKVEEKQEEKPRNFGKKYVKL